ncbi:hypothetical protein ABIC80_000406 [Kosakonia sp. 1610]|jgi:hypothetical protein|nr:hypothetical protein [Atlantibacter hermannii]MDT3412876.1 hypothetical protein [Atlantibacter sp. SORGH_AS_0304]
MMRITAVKAAVMKNSAIELPFLALAVWVK